MRGAIRTRLLAVAMLAGAGLLQSASPVLAQLPAPAPFDGARVYAENCSACHQGAGRGIPGAFPALVGDSWVVGEPPALATLLLNGRGGMPAFHDDLSDGQIAAVATYIRGAWGNQASPVAPTVVAAARGSKLMPPPNPLQAH